MVPTGFHPTMMGEKDSPQLDPSTTFFGVSLALGDVSVRSRKRAIQAKPKKPEAPPSSPKCLCS